MCEVKQSCDFCQVPLRQEPRDLFESGGGLVHRGSAWHLGSGGADSEGTSRSHQATAPDGSEVPQFHAAPRQKSQEVLHAKGAVAAFKRAELPCDEAQSWKYREHVGIYGAHISSQTESNAVNRADDR